MSEPRVLLVDDDSDLLQLLAMRLSASGYATQTCESGRAALALLGKLRPDVVVTDLRMEPMDGMALFHQIQKHWPSLPVIMLTAHGSIPDAVEATQKGLFSFLTKPVDNKELLHVVAQALELGSGPGPDTGWADTILTRSDCMFTLLERARLLARSDISVLIQGDSGTGKEVLAQAIHRASRRAGGPFIPINCGAIPADLLESELFGHVKGAFTGASQHREGLFAAAEGGTLFLDEIGDMPLPLQVKLLRVLQEHKVRPVGSSQDLTVDVRVVSATHRDLEAAIANQQFREDLYYRLNVASLALPNLKDRKQDIALLTEAFLSAIAERTGDALRKISPAGQRLLLQYDWPGNIRQLQNVVEQLVALSPTKVISDSQVAAVLPTQNPNEQFRPLKEAKLAFERDYLVQLLHSTSGNITEAARISGRHRSDLHKLMKRHQLDSDHFRPQ